METGFKLWTDAIEPRSLDFDPRYTCDLDNSSPELRWEGTPRETDSLLLTLGDLDARGRTGAELSDWIIYRLSSHFRHRPAGISRQEMLPNGIRQGMNSAGKLCYSGPYPPHGDPAHRCVFELLATRGAVPQTERGISGPALLAAVRSQIIGRAVCQRSYARALGVAGVWIAL